jgi:hypothetical protein
MKNWYLSKTIWGVFIALAGMAMHRSFPDVSTEIVEIIGLSLAAYGRIVAETKLK